MNEGIREEAGEAVWLLPVDNEAFIKTQRRLGTTTLNPDLINQTALNQKKVLRPMVRNPFKIKDSADPPNPFEVKA